MDAEKAEDFGLWPVGLRIRWNESPLNLGGDGFLMASYGRLDDYQSRCRQELLRLRILARGQDGTTLPWEFTVEVRDATNAVIAEVEAISRTAIRASEQLEPQAETFLWVRVARLAAAADRAVDAARSRDVPGLRAHLQQFDTLTSALWAVQHATYGNQPDSSPRRESNLRRAGAGPRAVMSRAPAWRP